MNRRTWVGYGIGYVSGFIGGFFCAPKAAEAKAAEVLDPTVAPRDSRGECVTRVYRETPDRGWREIQIAEINPGDKIICIGQDGDRLWRANSIKVISTEPVEPGSDIMASKYDPSDSQSLMTEVPGW